MAGADDLSGKQTTGWDFHSGCFPDSVLVPILRCPKASHFFSILHILDPNHGADVCEIIICKRCNLRKLRFYS